MYFKTNLKFTNTKVVVFLFTQNLNSKKKLEIFPKTLTILFDLKRRNK